VLNRDYGVHRFHVLANQTNSIQQGRELYNKLARVSEKYLDVALNFVGAVPYDEYLKKAVQKQKCVVEAFPRSPSAMAFRQIAKKAQQWPVPKNMEGHLEFFIERLVNYSSQENSL
jgi:flagellar biosynthesis protein FlhG